MKRLLPKAREERVRAATRTVAEEKDLGQVSERTVRIFWVGAANWM